MLVSKAVTLITFLRFSVAQLATFYNDLDPPTVALCFCFSLAIMPTLLLQSCFPPPQIVNDHSIMATSLLLIFTF